MNGFPLEEWYFDIPVITRTYLTLCTALAVGISLNILSPLAVCLSFPIIREKGEYWRILTNFAYFEGLGINFFIHIHFVYMYFRRSEQHFYHRHTADFVAMLLFGATALLIVAYFYEILFLSMPLMYYVLYIWCRRNPYEYMHVLGVMPVPAPYLPYLFLLVSYSMESPIYDDLLGIFIGHTFWFLSDILPGYIGRPVLQTPEILRVLFPQPVLG
ncbi:DER1-domain-containing protein [Perkinsela sp. CCAP 1560/4]|nr:DER1-domain-containing protein [Perkinsela sp. CCAP 1560/4]|eukprot:KNH05395.1 DER1-domain-containing protein [Perkinsela sp. CCAP 1560/4]